MAHRDKEVLFGFTLRELCGVVAIAVYGTTVALLVVASVYTLLRAAGAF